MQTTAVDEMHQFEVNVAILGSYFGMNVFTTSFTLPCIKNLPKKDHAFLMFIKIGVFLFKYIKSQQTGIPLP